MTSAVHGSNLVAESARLSEASHQRARVAGRLHFNRRSQSGPPVFSDAARREMAGGQKHRHEMKEATDVFWKASHEAFLHHVSFFYRGWFVCVG
jgi:hypothetical protein